MTLFDTAGVERHTQTMLPTYFRRAKTIILVYSIDNIESFGDISSNWMDNSVNVGTGAQIVLVGNKLDLDHENKHRTKRVISRERAVQYALLNDIDRNMVFEISAKTGQGVGELFDSVAKKIAPVRREESSEAKEQKRQQGDCSC